MAFKLWRGNYTSGTPDASYENGKVWSGNYTSGTPDARYENGKIWLGNYTSGTPDARYEDGLAPYGDKTLYELVEANSPVLSRRLKALGDYRKGGNKGFDTRITRLQSQGYVLISDFVYMVDKNGNEYGWGVAEYSTPEHFLGASFAEHVYEREPRESYERIREHLHRILPDASDQAIRRILK